MAETQSQGGGLRGALSTLLILGLVGAVCWLAAERNNHHYFIRTEGHTVLIDRGWELPYGHGPFHPKDPGQAQAYAAIKLPAGSKGPIEEEFEERGDLDRRLGEILLDAAKTRLAQSDPARLPEGIAYLDQASLLQQLTSEQRHQLQSQRAEVAYFEASDRISRALGALQDARGLLKLATTGSPSHAREAADSPGPDGARAGRLAACHPELPPFCRPTTPSCLPRRTPAPHPRQLRPRRRTLAQPQPRLRPRPRPVARPRPPPRPLPRLRLRPRSQSRTGTWMNWETRLRSELAIIGAPLRSRSRANLWT